MDSFAHDDASALETSEYQQASQTFVGQWDRLVSRTNWDKGRIIAQWRDALVAAAAPSAEFSDDAWSKLVGGVTPQHVGRLRRTYQRFFEHTETYPTLFWSHFHAAVDWNDAELWLEGAKLNDWSVAQMRRKRWEQMGKIDAEPQAGEVVAAETDEDFDPQAAGATTEVRDPAEFDGETADGPRHEGSDFGDEDGATALDDGETTGGDEAPFDVGPAPQRPFENLAALPADLHEAVESFKLAILHHKLSGWTEVTPQDVVAHLRALEQLAVAPS
jgi:hypothetical protein